VSGIDTSAEAVERDAERTALNRAIDLRALHIVSLTSSLERAENDRDARVEADRLGALLERAMHLVPRAFSDLHDEARAALAQKDEER
jgi:hypothetical protein